MPELLPRARAIPMGRPAAPSDLGSGEGLATFSGLAAGTARVTERLDDADQRMRAARAEGRALSRLEEGVADITSDPDYTTYEERYQKLERDVFTEEGEAAGLKGPYLDDYQLSAEKIGSRAGLQVRAAGRKRQLDVIQANAHGALLDLANQEARAASEGDRRAIRQRASEVLGTAYGIGAFDTAERDKAALAYDAAVSGAAVTKGLTEDPRQLRAALEARAGIFATMNEKDRQTAIITAKRREESLASQGRAAVRFAQAQDDRRLRDEAQAAAVKGYEALASSQGLTPELYAELEPDLAGAPNGLPALKYFSEVVAKGGRVAPGPPSPAEVGRLDRLRREDPLAFAVEPLDPGLLGSAYGATLAQQRAVLDSKPASTEGFQEAVWQRYTRMYQAETERAHWWRPGDSPELASGEGQKMVMNPALSGEFLLIAQQLRERKAAGGRQLTDTDEQKVLDDTVMEFVRRHPEVPPTFSGLATPIGGPQPAPIPPATEASIRSSLALRQIPATPENVRAFYQKALAEGRISE